MERRVWMNKFYIASSLKNIDSVQYVSEILVNKGYVQTYDWTKNERASSLDALTEIGQKELTGVKAADFLIVLQPAGKGSHIELGIALGQGKTIILYTPEKKIEDLKTTCTFYHLPEIKKCGGDLAELIELVTKTVAVTES